MKLIFHFNDITLLDVFWELLSTREKKKNHPQGGKTETAEAWGIKPSQKDEKPTFDMELWAGESPPEPVRNLKSV